MITISKTNTLILLFSLIGECLFSQNTFEKIYRVPYGEQLSAGGYYPEMIIQESNGDFILGGSRSTGIESSNSFLMRINSSGDTIWSKNIQQTGANSIIKTMDNGFLITTSEVIGFINWSASVLLIKTNSIGDTMWIRKYGTGTGNIDNLNSGGSYTLQTNSGNYITIGFTNAYGAGNNDIYLIKTSNNGSTLWKKVIGGSGIDNGVILRQTSDNGFILCGYTTSSGPAGYNTMLIKTDSTGNISWAKTYGLTGAEFPKDIVITNDHGFLVTGYTNFAGNYDIFIYKTDSLGNLLWSKTIGNAYTDVSYDILYLTGGNFIVTGCYTNSNNTDREMLLMKFNNIGDTLWTKGYGGVLYSNGYVSNTTNDNGIITLGTSTYNFGSGYFDYLYLVKTDQSGNSNCSQNITMLTITPTVFLTSSLTLQQTSSGITGFLNYCPTYYAHLKDTTLCSYSSISENKFTKNESIQLFPNPTSSNITINSNNQELTLINIYDITGFIIYNKQIENMNQVNIDVSYFPKGIYFLKVIGDYYTETKKIIIQ